MKNLLFLFILFSSSSFSQEIIGHLISNTQLKSNTVHATINKSSLSL